MNLHHPRFRVPDITPFPLLLLLRSFRQDPRVVGKPPRQGEELISWQIHGFLPAQVVNRAEIGYHITLIVQNPCDFSVTSG